MALACLVVVVVLAAAPCRALLVVVEMLKIRRNALLSALEGAKNLYPDEFVGLLRGEQRGGDVLLTELILAPFSNYDSDSSSYSPWFIPANTGELASFHSHPEPNSCRPSRADLSFFARSGPYHFIACPPYSLKDVKAFDSKGKEVEFEVKG